MWRPEVGCVDTAAAAVLRAQLVVDDGKTLSREILAAQKKPQKLASYFQQVLSPAPPAPGRSSLQHGEETHPAFFFFFLIHSLSIGFVCCFFQGGRAGVYVIFLYSMEI